MKIAVLGLWHLGCVTAACCAKHFTVVGTDSDPTVIEQLQRGKAPLMEPGLDDLLKSRLDSGRLKFTTDLQAACADADLLWVSYDTPVDEDDRADVDSVLRGIRAAVAALPRGALVLVSSQLPVGTCRQLENEFGAKGYRFACSPENLRLGKALEIFTRPDRIVAGCRDPRTQVQLTELFAPFTSQIVWMSPESAEMTKHAINAFLATSITFMNEIAGLCEVSGADAKEVERGLKSESRIGPKAYLSPGGAFAGGTLARDVLALVGLGLNRNEPIEVLSAIKRSNDQHRLWAFRKISRALPDPAGHTVAVLGLTYKPGTDTLRRSSAVELATALHTAGFQVRAYDPSRSFLPANLDFIQLKPTPLDALVGADAVVICTEWPEFRHLDWPKLVQQLRQPFVIDASRFLAENLAKLPALRYATVGSPL